MARGGNTAFYDLVKIVNEIKVHGDKDSDQYAAAILDMLRPANIKLEYRMIVLHGDNSYYARSAEVFVDEHGFQWIKFVSSNGYYKDREHMVRADQAILVRREKDD